MAAKAKKTASVAVVSPFSDPTRIDAERAARVAEAAYYLSEARGFAPGHEMADWLEAEAMISADAGKP